MIGVLVISVFVGFVSGRPSDNLLRNVITVPPNCPAGQQWVNGVCRDVWRTLDASITNVITVPPNCPPGQEYINGACRDVWRTLDASITNVITVPPNCPPGQEYINGACRDVWIKAQIENKIKDFNNIMRNTVTTPPNCPPGQQYFNGACRVVWRSNYGIPENVITALSNCPTGQEFINGACRDGGKRVYSYGTSENMIEPVQVEFFDRNVISVPNQCPVGYKPDAFGVCREIFRK